MASEARSKTGVAMARRSQRWTGVTGERTIGSDTFHVKPGKSGPATDSACIRNGCCKHVRMLFGRQKAVCEIARLSFHASA